MKDGGTKSSTRSLLPPARVSAGPWPLRSLWQPMPSRGTGTKKGRKIRVAPGDRHRQNQSLCRAESGAAASARTGPKHSPVHHHRAADKLSRNRRRPPCGMRCAMSPASVSRRAKAGALRGITLPCAASARATNVSRRRPRPGHVFQGHI